MVRTKIKKAGIMIALMFFLGSEKSTAKQQTHLVPGLYASTASSGFEVSLVNAEVDPYVSFGTGYVLGHDFDKSHATYIEYEMGGSFLMAGTGIAGVGAYASKAASGLQITASGYYLIPIFIFARARLNVMSLKQKDPLQLGLMIKIPIEVSRKKPS